MDSQNDGLTFINDNTHNEDWLTEAEKLLREEYFDKAENLLRKSIEEMPVGWKPLKKAEIDTRYFWNQQEFINFTEYHRPNVNSFLWSFPSYSKAHYLIAFILSEQGMFREALHEINRGLILEADHPKLLSEKAFIYAKLGDDEKSLYFYEMAATARPWITAQEKSRYLRDKAVTLMNLDRLDEAEKTLSKSQSLDPDNKELEKDFDFLKELRLKNHEQDNTKVQTEITQQMEEAWQIFQEKGNDGVIEWLIAKEKNEDPIS